MTGHHHHNQSRGTNPLRIETPTLNQQAANLAQARNENNPYIRDLAHIEPRFIAELLRRLDTPGTDHTTIGAVLLAAGQLAGQIVQMIRGDAQQHAAPMLTNLLQLAGQQLYMGKLTHATGCPYPYATGEPCGYLGKAETADQLDAVMRGHIALHHPDQTWPVKEPDSAEAAGEDPYPLTALGENPSFEQLKRFANLRVLAMTYLGVDRDHGDPITGRKGDLTPQAAWEQAERDYDRLLAAGEPTDG